MDRKAKDFSMGLVALVLSPGFFYLFSSEGQVVITGAWWWLMMVVWTLMCGGCAWPYVSHQLLEVLAPRSKVQLSSQGENKRDFRPLIMVLCSFVVVVGFTAFVVYGHMVEAMQSKLGSGSPEDAVTIRRITNERIGAENSRDEWQKKYEASQRELASREETIEKLESLQETLTIAAEDRKKRAELRLACATWSQRIKREKYRLANEGILENDKWEKMKLEFTSFARENFTQDQLVLLDSNMALGLAIVWPKHLRGEDKYESQQKWTLLSRWEANLNQIIVMLSHPQ
ncbi:hypothetical protein Mal64_36100 [Pseudobythopirellula maris]|uniref:Uncharacterized protein n=1 Tax=Pseudobythopirellula maris TaxID=2527991 RepID=A0A5C5ZI20_9BACT|nr:hypothetical protein [Pseudobythopirellula maris]TWT86780.1 hypothetical protein Mal64_36100 [Pseudobythopirellula maris]